jgi:hypothetical protein
MTAYPLSAAAAATGGRPNFLRRTEAWLDRKGRGAWIAAMVLSFVLFWPIGLALVFYITYTNRWSGSKMMTCTPRSSFRHHRFGHTGNAAFDSYKSEMLKRLEDEQTAFEAFLQRLRDAKDKSEFDAFMEDRAKGARATEVDANPAPRTGEY